MNPGAQKTAFRPREAKTFHFKAALQAGGWISPAFIHVDARGIITEISQTAPSAESSVESVNGFALPGFQNAHSHAFQYAMAGMAEKHRADTVDDFWSWREAMYACALSLDPVQLQAVAAMLYCEMLRRGYTHVAEFQYLHHDKNGKPYDNLAEMSVCLVAAAAIVGIRITLVPVFYQKGGFGKEADTTQRRFCFDNTDQYFKLLDECSRVVKSISTAQVGFGVHSLRAAGANEIIRIVGEGPTEIPFHIHAAEQRKEVNDSLQYLKQRPVEWLLNNLELNERFHLIHCTHLTDAEVNRLAASKANVVLCPGTEANLGDGVFRLTDFSQRSGHWSIGTDSHISLNPLEDLRWLDYAQRLSTHKRNTFADGAAVLMANTFFTGKRAMGIRAGEFFEIGQPFDAVVYDGESPLLSIAGLEHLLSTLIYTGDSAAVIGTIVNGEWMVKGYAHKNQQQIFLDFQAAIKNMSVK